MSVEASRAQPATLLALIARPGIAVRLLNGALKEVARGLERLEAQLPQGLYLVEWSSAGQQSQTMVSLDGGKDRVEVRFDPSDISSDAALDAGVGSRVALVDAVNGALRPSERNYESSIVLVVSGEPDALEHAGDLDLRLYNRSDIAMRSNREDAPNLVLAAGERAHSYRVRPGRYHIGFQSILGEHLGQSVAALASRQTLVFLTVAKTKLIVADGGEFNNEESVGIDPAHTTIVTVRGDEDDYRVRERVRLAGLMLFDLANGTNSLSPDVVEVLEDPKTDPLLRLYGTLVALSALERGVLSASAEGSPSALTPQFDQSWIGRLRDWVGDPGQAGLPTDAISACWALQRLQPQPYGSATWPKTPSRIEAPPMFECAWRWAIEESVLRPDAVRGSAVVATARSAGGTLPWLCWRIAAAKARFVPVATTMDDLPSLILQVAEKVSALIEPDGFQRTLSQGLETLSPEIQATALRAMQLVVPDANEVAIDTVTDLAVALGLPSRLLRKRLVNTSVALDNVASSILADSLERSPAKAFRRSAEQAPGLSRGIRFKNDLQKGRFGGKSSRAGFVTTAEFEKTISKNWVRVVLRVEGPAHDGEEVQFHLHDSFKPPLETRKFKRGAAKLSVTVWGGFTLGVWIPSNAIELELDLSELSDAPRIMRER